MSVITITRLTFHEALRRKIVLAAVVLGVLFLVIFALGFHYVMADMEKQIYTGNLLAISEISNFLLMAGLYVVNFLTVMMSVLTSVNTLSGEISTGTIQTLVSKPLRRWEIVLGKWLGFAGMLTLYLVLMAGGVMAIIYVISGYTPPNPLRGLALLWMNALLMLSVCLLGGSSLSTMANGVMVFGLFGVSFIGGWIEQIGSFFQNQAASSTAVNIGIFTSLILPSEAIWKRVVYEIQSPLVASVGLSPFSSSSVPSMLMIVYSVLYIAGALVLSVYQFSRRDL